jgi:hypothetical protein
MMQKLRKSVRSKLQTGLQLWKTSAKKSLGHYELQQHKPRFDDEYSKLIDRRKQAKLQWLQNPSQVNGDNMDNIRCEASRTFRTKKKGISEKQNELEKTVRTGILEICTELNSRRVINREITW